MTPLERLRADLAALCDESVDHIKDNAKSLLRWPEMQEESRARELGATFLRELAWMIRTTDLAPYAADPDDLREAVDVHIALNSTKEPAEKLPPQSAHDPRGDESFAAPGDDP